MTGYKFLPGSRLASPRLVLDSRVSLQLASALLRCRRKEMGWNGLPLRSRCMLLAHLLHLLSLRATMRPLVLMSRLRVGSLQCRARYCYPLNTGDFVRRFSAFRRSKSSSTEGNAEVNNLAVSQSGQISVGQRRLAVLR